MTAVFFGSYRTASACASARSAVWDYHRGRKPKTYCSGHEPMKSLMPVTRKKVGGRLPRRSPSRALLLAGFAFASCTRYVAVDPERGPQAYYQTGFPLQDMSIDLEQTLASIVRIHVERSYDRYVFPGDDAAIASQPQGAAADLLSRAIDTVPWRRSRAATAVIIATSRERLTLLTTNHAIYFPDTIVEYFGSQDGATGPESGPRAIESISIKTGQTTAMVRPSQVEPFEILARSEPDDLALIGVTLPEVETVFLPLPPPSPEVPVLELANGDPRRLSWGSFVYLLGHPGGFRMVTRGIVSEPDRRPDGSFLIDGIWNEGMSGAPILAVRGDGGGLEWVGIAQAASARTEYRLVSEESAERTQDPRRPYEGPIYLQPAQEIRYGISFSVPVTVIRRFIEDEGSRLRDLGYPLPSF